MQNKYISHIFICSCHFELPRDLIPLRKLPFDAVPTIEIPVPNRPVVSNIMECDNSVQPISVTSIPHHSCKLYINYIEIKICMLIVRVTK